MKKLIIAGVILIAVFLIGKNIFVQNLNNQKAQVSNTAQAITAGTIQGNKFTQGQTITLSLTFKTPYIPTNKPLYAEFLNTNKQMYLNRISGSGNTTTFTAVVPADVTPGTYELIVSDTDTVRNLDWFLDGQYVVERAVAPQVVVTPVAPAVPNNTSNTNTTVPTASIALNNPRTTGFDLDFLSIKDILPAKATISARIAINQMPLPVHDNKVAYVYKSKLHIGTSDTYGRVIDFPKTVTLGPTLNGSSRKFEYISLNVADLVPNTLYHYKVVVSDQLGRTMTSSDMTFRTPATQNVGNADGVANITSYSGTPSYVFAGKKMFAPNDLITLKGTGLLNTKLAGYPGNLGYGNDTSITFPAYLLGIGRRDSSSLGKEDGVQGLPGNDTIDGVNYNENAVSVLRSFDQYKQLIVPARVLHREIKRNVRSQWAEGESNPIPMTDAFLWDDVYEFSDLNKWNGNGTGGTFVFVPPIENAEKFSLKGTHFYPYFIGNVAMPKYNIGSKHKIYWASIASVPRISIYIENCGPNGFYPRQSNLGYPNHRANRISISNCMITKIADNIPNTGIFEWTVQNNLGAFLGENNRFVLFQNSSLLYGGYDNESVAYRTQGSVHKNEYMDDTTTSPSYRFTLTNTQNRSVTNTAQVIRPEPLLTSTNPIRVESLFFEDDQKTVGQNISISFRTVQTGTYGIYLVGASGASTHLGSKDVPILRDYLNYQVGGVKSAIHRSQYVIPLTTSSGKYKIRVCKDAISSGICVDSRYSVEIAH